MIDDRSTHGHLWSLDDGTPVHAPPGRLTRNEDGQLCCHLCGRWFDHLGAHLRRHGWTAAAYRAAVGLAAGRALCHDTLSTTIRARQVRQWQADETLRQTFDRGRVAGTRAITAPDRDRRCAPEVAATATANLRHARATREAARLADLEHAAAGAGHADIDAFLRHRYDDGDSLADLQRLTGWARGRVRQRLEAAGAVIRASGRTTPAGRENRARILDARVSARIGADDVDAWLRTAAAQGQTVAALARQTGRSDTWVRTRLRRGPRADRHAG